jgi:hypothetical protein
VLAGFRKASGGRALVDGQPVFEEVLIIDQGRLVLQDDLYQAMDWPHEVDAERLYDADGPYPLVFVSYWALLLTWATMGLLLGAGFYRSNGGELVAIALACAWPASCPARPSPGP